ncbi:MAG: Flp pilus assembly protein CpaB [Syntrophomonadaceae bacterium]|nr:Flp pilus assembly protein CpaB [Syntrophomonadaceae bacterium]
MRNKLVLGLALFFGLAAAFLTYFYLQQLANQAQNRLYTNIVMAAKDIPANTTITGDMVELKPFPTDLRNNRELVDINEAVGKVNIVVISKGEIISQNRLIKPGESTDRLAYTIPQGLRAMSIPVDEITGVANMIRRGDRVDIIAGVANADGSNERSVVILQNVEVLAVGTSISDSSVPNPDDNAAPRTVTLAVDPQSSLRIKMALIKGNTSLILRSPVDQKPVATVPFNPNEF